MLQRNYIENTLRKIDFDHIGKHPNILIAARFWEDDRFEAATRIYKFMRTIDDMIDDRKAAAAAISCMEKRLFTDQVLKWIRCLDKTTEDPFLEEVADTIEKFRIPLHFFHSFARSMVFDINNDGFKTFGQFLEYAEGASNGPASVFVHLCCLDKVNGQYVKPSFPISDIARPCAIFSYIVHIIRDFQKDQSDNLNYFALDILDKNGLTPEDLRKIALGGVVTDPFRQVIRKYLSLAELYRQQTLQVLEELDGKLEPRYMLSLRMIYDLYLQIMERIDPEKGTFSTAELNPTPAEIKDRVMMCIHRFHPIHTPATA